MLVRICGIRRGLLRGSVWRMGGWGGGVRMGRGRGFWMSLWGGLGRGGGIREGWGRRWMLGEWSVVCFMGVMGTQEVICCGWVRGNWAGRLAVQ